MTPNPEQVRNLAAAVTGHTLCPDCADTLLTLLDAVHKARTPGPEGATPPPTAGAPAPTPAPGTGTTTERDNETSQQKP